MCFLEVEFTLPMPPSVNKLYQQRRGGGKALTKAAHEYRHRVSQIIVDDLHKLQKFPVTLDTVYSFDLTLYFITLENQGWYQFKNGERQAKTRFKTIDVDNRIKFLQDCIITSIGIPNDSQIFEGSQRKVLGETDHAVVKITVREPSEFLRRASGRTESQ